jgi:hypothetical protein
MTTLIWNSLFLRLTRYDDTNLEQFIFKGLLAITTLIWNSLFLRLTRLLTAV